MADRCPYLGLADDAGQAQAQPSSAHRCHASSPPARIGTVFQVSACLRPAHQNCPRFRDVTASQAEADSAARGRRKLHWSGLPAVLPEGERREERVHPAATPVPMPASPLPPPASPKARRPVTVTELAVLGMGLSILLAFLFVGYALVYRLQLAGVIGASSPVAQAPATLAPRLTPVPTFTATPSPTPPLPAGTPGGAPPAPTPTPEPPAPTPTPLARPPASSPPTRLVIPKIEVDIPVVPVGLKKVTVGGKERVLWDDVAGAAAFHQTTAYPGNPGNTVLNGHRDIRGAVFFHLNKMEAGDEVVLYVGDVAYRYEVSETLIVPETFASAKERAENLKLIGHMPEERLTLITCTPVGLATHRLLVIAKPPEAAAPGMPEAGSDAIP